MTRANGPEVSGHRKAATASSRGAGTDPAGTDRFARVHDATGGRRGRWRRTDTAWALLLVLLAFTITLLGVGRGTSFSLYDEATHADYALRIASGELPFAGSKLAPEVLREWSCRSQDGFEEAIPPCAGTHSASSYPARGENYNYSHPPTYYAITAAAASLAQALPVGLTFFSAARLTGAFWLAAALVGMYIVLRQWKVPRQLAASAAAILAAAPSVAHASSIVTNDAPGVLAGVLALWVLTRVAVQSRLDWLLPAALAAFVASIKVIHAVSMLAVAAVVLALALAAFRKGERRRGRALAVISLGIVGAVGLVHLGWSAYQAGRATPDWISPITGINTDPVVGGPVDDWAPTLASGFGVTQSFWVQDSLASDALLFVAPALAVLMTAAVFVNVSVFAPGDARRLVGWVAFVGCAVLPLLVQIQAYINSADYFPYVSSRYAMSLLPLTVAAFAMVVHLREWRVATVLVSGCSVAVLLLSFGGVL